MSTQLPTDLPPDVILSGAYEAGIIALTIVSVAAVWLRMYTRIRITHNTSWDDWLMFAASVPTSFYAFFKVRRTDYQLALSNS